MGGSQSEYFVWEFGDLDRGDAPPPKLLDPSAVDELDLKRGKKVKAKVPPVAFVVRRNRELVDYQFNMAGLPLFSERLRDAVSKGKSEIQFFDVRLTNEAGKDIPARYYLANVVGLVQAFDWDRSEFDETYRPQGVASHIEKLVLRKDLNTDLDLFRLAEAPRVLIVSGRLRNDLETAGITGIEFLEPKDYTG